MKRYRRTAVWAFVTMFCLISTACTSTNEQKTTAITPEKIKSNEPLPLILLQTSQGDVTVELFEDEAPNTVANFVNLVEKGYYDGLKFHRVMKGFMAQGGRSKDGLGYNIKCECYRDDARKHARGVLSMAHAGRDTGGSQFFITFVKTDFLDGKHTVFGRVIKGMENVDKFTRTGGGGRPDTIKKAIVVQKRDHEYKPKTVKK